MDGFRLVGGTGLALQLGHRISVDIDLFTDKDFDKTNVSRLLQKEFETYVLDWQNVNELVTRIDNIKVDLFNWNVSFIRPPVVENDIVAMDKLEIGAMKLETITTRKDKKDFFDIAFLLQEFSIRELLTCFRSKYPFLNHKMVLESLMAVDFADETNEPVLIKKMTWEDAKKIIVDSVLNFFEAIKDESVRQQQERLRKAEYLLKKKKNKE